MEAGTTERRLPRIRALEPIPFNTEQGTMVGLHDRQQIAPSPMALTVPAYLLACLMDGATTFVEAREELARQVGSEPTDDQIDALIHALDESLFLHNERFETEYGRRRDAYAASAARDNRERWPAAGELVEQMQRIVKHQRNPAPSLRGIVAPHLDYERGELCYADAYAALSPARRYVILGTNHFGRGACVTATRKDFVTPLGRVATDRDFLGALETRVGQSLCKHEFDHHLEHSIELHAHLLQALHPKHPFSIVPILCPDPCGPTGTAPRDGDGVDLGAFADALAELIENDGSDTVLIASADLSHVGRRFGESEATTPEFLAQVGENDQRLLALLTARREEQFVEAVQMADNATRICSVGCIYALLRALPNAEFQLLRYHQAIDMAAETHVTCAAALLCDPA